MNLIAAPTTISEAEAKLLRAEQVSAAALEGLRAAAVESFRSFWHTGDTAEQAAKMGANARAAFERHALTVQYLLAMGVQLDPADYTPPEPYRIEDDNSLTLL